MDEAGRGAAGDRHHRLRDVLLHPKGGDSMHDLLVRPEADVEQLILVEDPVCAGELM